MPCWEIVNRTEASRSPNRRFQVVGHCANKCGGSRSGGPRSGKHVVRIMGIPVAGYCDNCIVPIRETLERKGA